MYRERILPYHRRHYAELYGKGPHSIHLCGDATRHFKTIRDELNVRSFDTGYPVDFGRLRKELGPDVEIYGGPSVPFLRAATPTAAHEETRRILTSGVMEGGRFVLREGNNLAPGIRLENLWAMWDTVHEFGTY
jgi:uroporphyrinogen-III decarboxylase